MKTYCDNGKEKRQSPVPEELRALRKEELAREANAPRIACEKPSKEDYIFGLMAGYEHWAKMLGVPKGAVATVETVEDSQGVYCSINDARRDDSTGPFEEYQVQAADHRGVLDYHYRYVAPRGLGNSAHLPRGDEHGNVTIWWEHDWENDVQPKIMKGPDEFLDAMYRCTESSQLADIEKATGIPRGLLFAKALELQQQWSRKRDVARAEPAAHETALSLDLEYMRMNWALKQTKCSNPDHTLAVLVKHELYKWAQQNGDARMNPLDLLVVQRKVRKKITTHGFDMEEFTAIETELENSNDRLPAETFASVLGMAGLTLDEQQFVERRALDALTEKEKKKAESADAKAMYLQRLRHENITVDDVIDVLRHYVEQNPGHHPLVSMELGRLQEATPGRQVPLSLILASAVRILSMTDKEVSAGEKRLCAMRFGYYSIDGANADPDATKNVWVAQIGSVHAPTQPPPGSTYYLVAPEDDYERCNALLQEMQKKEFARGASIAEVTDKLGAVWVPGQGDMPMADLGTYCDSLFKRRCGPGWNPNGVAPRAEQPQKSCRTGAGDGLLFMDDSNDRVPDDSKTVEVTPKLLDLVGADDPKVLMDHLHELLDERRRQSRLESGGYHSVKTPYALIFSKTHDMREYMSLKSGHSAYDALPEPYFTLGDIATALGAVKVLRAFMRIFSAQSRKPERPFRSMVLTMIRAKTHERVIGVLCEPDCINRPSGSFDYSFGGGGTLVYNFPKRPVWPSAAPSSKAVGLETNWWTCTLIVTMLDAWAQVPLPERPALAVWLAPVVRRATDRALNDCFNTERVNCKTWETREKVKDMLLEEADTPDMAAYVSCKMWQELREDGVRHAGEVLMEIFRVCVVGGLLDAGTVKHVVQAFVTGASDAPSHFPKIREAMFEAQKGACWHYNYFQWLEELVHLCLATNNLPVALGLAGPWQGLIFDSPLNEVDEDPLEMRWRFHFLGSKHLSTYECLKATRSQMESSIKRLHEKEKKRADSNAQSLLEAEKQAKVDAAAAAAAARSAEQQKKQERAQRRKEQQAEEAKAEAKRKQEESRAADEHLVKTWAEGLHQFIDLSRKNRKTYFFAKTDKDRAFCVSRLVKRVDDLAKLEPALRALVWKRKPWLVLVARIVQQKNKKYIQAVKQALKPAAPKPAPKPTALPKPAPKPASPPGETSAKKRGKQKMRAPPEPAPEPRPDAFFDVPPEALDAEFVEQQRQLLAAFQAERGRGGRGAAPAAPTGTLADAPCLTTPPPESTLGGQTTCIVCMEAEKSHAAVPCGHMCVCAGCADKIAKGDKKCPICRAGAATWLKVHVA